MNDRIMHNRLTQRYQVRLGHSTVIVQATSSTEAIRLARKQLSDEMPRLWDVIHRLEDQQFRVDPRHD